MKRLIARCKRTFLGVTVLEYALMLVLTMLAAVSILGHLVPPDEPEVATRPTAAFNPPYDKNVDPDLTGT